MGSADSGSERKVSDFRVVYDLGRLDEGDLAPTPLLQFRAWFAAAVAADVYEPNAMVLSTSTPDAQPSSRTVLLKDVDSRGFVFYSNHLSRKGRELSENPGVSCLFPWFTLHRQVIVVGRAERVGRDEVREYWDSRPHGSRLGAWASAQSTVIEGRDGLEARYAELQEQYPEGSDVPLPDQWGGWLIRPATIEFWQGRESRLHDRMRFSIVDPQVVPDLSAPEQWTAERLSP